MVFFPTLSFLVDSLYSCDDGSTSDIFRIIPTKNFINITYFNMCVHGGLQPILNFFPKFYNCGTNYESMKKGF